MLGFKKAAGVGNEFIFQLVVASPFIFSGLYWLKMFISWLNTRTVHYEYFFLSGWNGHLSWWCQQRQTSGVEMRKFTGLFSLLCQMVDIRLLKRFDWSIKKTKSSYKNACSIQECTMYKNDLVSGKQMRQKNYFYSKILEIKVILKPFRHW